jgi:hypothetical protein
MRRKKWESWGKTRTWVVLEFCLTSIRKGDDDGWVKCRKVVEHVVLFQMKEDFTDEQEKDMLDHLFTLQYRFRGILAISLGRCGFLKSTLQFFLKSKCMLLFN